MCVYNISNITAGGSVYFHRGVYNICWKVQLYIYIYTVTLIARGHAGINKMLISRQQGSGWKFTVKLNFPGAGYGPSSWRVSLPLLLHPADTWGEQWTVYIHAYTLYTYVYIYITTTNARYIYRVNYDNGNNGKYRTYVYIYRLQGWRGEKAKSV